MAYTAYFSVFFIPQNIFFDTSTLPSLCIRQATDVRF
jgi:hypothetical protein